jgi:hypothetical protein
MGLIMICNILLIQGIWIDFSCSTPMGSWDPGEAGVTEI